MRHYKHLTLYERENLLFLRAKGYSITAIAKSLGRNKGTISRELRQNSVANQYMPVVAQHQYQARRAYCKPHNRLEHARLLEHVKHRLLECQWSPEEIAGRLRAEYGRCVISTTTIYRAIYSGWLNAPKASTASVIKKLRYRGKRRKKRSIEEKRGKIQISPDITERPAGAENRSEIGHWEADTVVGKQGKACLVTLVNRKSRYLMCGKADKKNAQAVSKAMVARHADFGDMTVHAYVTENASGSRRLFFCTADPAAIHMSCAWQEKASLKDIGSKDMEYLPMRLYDMRWNIEVGYYEQKTFWDLSRYMIRSKTGIERMLNLVNTAHSAMKILPYHYDCWKDFQNKSPQELRFAMSEQIRRQVFLTTLSANAETTGKSRGFVDTLIQLVDEIWQAA